jgi:hypothetical protein
MYIRAACWIMSLSLIFAVAAPHASASAKPPNIVFIFVDDQGYYDLGCYGATEIKTPRIDAMAQQGTRFTDYYAAAPISSVAPTVVPPATPPPANHMAMALAL